MQLRGSHVVVTGASRGIGEAIARALASRGASVTCVARNEAAITALAAELGGHAVPCDLADPAQVDGLIGRIEATAGPVDVLVNNAGIATLKLLDQYEAAEVSATLQVNLVTPIDLCRQVLPGMLERGRGHLVNMSSLAACGGFSGMTTYSSTKAALSQFTGVLRVELKGTPIRTTLVTLGPVPSDMLDQVHEFRPTELAFERFYKLQLIVDVPATKVATAVADAIAAERRYVRLPKRAVLFPMLNESTRRLAEFFIADLPRR